MLLTVSERTVSEVQAHEKDSFLVSPIMHGFSYFPNQKPQMQSFFTLLLPLPAIQSFCIDHSTPSHIPPIAATYNTHIKLISVYSLTVGQEKGFPNSKNQYLPLLCISHLISRKNKATRPYYQKIYENFFPELFRSYPNTVHSEILWQALCWKTDKDTVG